MDLATIIAEARQIIGQPDYTQSNFQDPQLTTWANEFYRRAAVKLEYLPIKERTYTTGTSIALDPETFRVDRVKMLIKAFVGDSGKWRELVMLDFRELYDIDPDWENVATGEPEYFVRTGTFTARLHPAPNAFNDAVADGLKTHGLEFPTALSADGDTPDLPGNIQDLFPYFVAYKCFIRLGEKERIGEQFQLWNGALQEMKSPTTRISKERGWSWPGLGGTSVGKLWR